MTKSSKVFSFPSQPPVMRLPILQRPQKWKKRSFDKLHWYISRHVSKVGNLKGYLFWPPFLKVFCQKWKFGRAKEMSASAGIWTRVPRSKGSYAIQWATPLLIENQQKLASYNNFCFGPFLTKNFQKGNGQNRYIFELLTLTNGEGRRV